MSSKWDYAVGRTHPPPTHHAQQPQALFWLNGGYVSSPSGAFHQPRQPATSSQELPLRRNARGWEHGSTQRDLFSFGNPQPPEFDAPSSWHSNWNANSDECAHVVRLGSVLRGGEAERLRGYRRCVASTRQSTTFDGKWASLPRSVTIGNTHVLIRPKSHIQHIYICAYIQTASVWVCVYEGVCVCT